MLRCTGAWGAPWAHCFRVPGQPFSRPYPLRTLNTSLFKVDGTLTVPVLDFPKMRRVVGVPEGQDVLDFLAGLEPAERAQREAALHAVEEEGMAAMQVMPGVEELAKHLDERAVPRWAGWGGGRPRSAAGREEVTDPLRAGRRNSAAAHGGVQGTPSVSHAQGLR